MSTISNNSVQQSHGTVMVSGTTKLMSTKTKVNTTTKFERSRGIHPTKPTDSSDTDSPSLPALTFSSSASSSDTVTESEATHSAEEECAGSEVWPPKVSCLNLQTRTPLVSAEFDSYFDAPLTPKADVARKLSLLSLQISNFKAEDDAGYESGKEGDRTALGMSRPKLSRVESFKRRGSAQTMQQYRQTNLMRASPLHAIPISASTAAENKSSGNLAGPVRPIQPIRSPSEATIKATNTATTREIYSQFEDSTPSPVSSPETLKLPKLRLRPTILDRRPSINEGLPPLLIDTSGSSTESRALPIFLRGSRTPMTMNAFLTIASQANTPNSESPSRAKKQYKDETNRKIGIGRPSAKESQRAVTSPSKPGSSTAQQDQNSESVVPKQERAKIPRVHSLALMQKHTLPYRPSYQRDILQNRSSHAYLIPSPPITSPKIHVSTPFPSPKAENPRKLNDETIVTQNKVNSISSQKPEDLEIQRKSNNPYFNF